MSDKPEMAIVSEFQKSAPVDVNGLARTLGIPVFQDSDMPADMSGKLERTTSASSSSGYRIVVNAAHSLSRKRFTVAHEIAHYILHRSEVTDDAYYRSALSGGKETEANRLAAEILMPFSLIEALMKDDGMDDVRSLAQRLGVSEVALKYRLGIPVAE